MPNETTATPPPGFLCSVVVPAYNEGSVIEQRLAPLLTSFAIGELEVAIVANGCTDDTAEAARRLPGVRVLELAEPSKTAALNSGDAMVTGFPRIYLDADVRITATALRRLAEALTTDRPVVGAPRVTFDDGASSWVVRAFFRVFAVLPYASEGLVGLGVYGLSEAGRRRFGRFPNIVADDLYVQNLFRSEERVIVADTFEVVVPRDARGLLAVRTRVARGNRELIRRAEDPHSMATGGPQTIRALAKLIVTRSRLIPHAAVYIAINLLARSRARRATPGAAWERDESSRSGTRARVLVDGVPTDAVTETEVVQHVMRALGDGAGGRIVTPNVNIHQLLRRPEHASLIEGVELVVADGMPLVWASRLQGEPLPERVTGSSLIWSLARAAAAESRSVFLLGAEPAVAATAQERMTDSIPCLSVAGRHSPSFGFETSLVERLEIVDTLIAAAPDIVFVGLGFPKQERLMQELHVLLPSTWFIGCGGSIDFVAGRVKRAPVAVQRLGFEWLFRLAQEPRRLFGRYVLHGIPHALAMLARTALVRARRGGHTK